MSITHLDIDLDTTEVLVTRSEAEMTINVDMPAVEIGVPGSPGLVKVEHGADPNVPRPAVPLVYWVGTVRPNNAVPDDLLMLKEA